MFNFCRFSSFDTRLYCVFTKLTSPHARYYYKRIKYYALTFFLNWAHAFKTSQGLPTIYANVDQYRFVTFQIGFFQYKYIYIYIYESNLPVTAAQVGEAIPGRFALTRFIFLNDLLQPVRRRRQKHSPPPRKSYIYVYPHVWDAIFSLNARRERGNNKKEETSLVKGDRRRRTHVGRVVFSSLLPSAKARHPRADDLNHEQTCSVIVSGTRVFEKYGFFESPEKRGCHVCVLYANAPTLKTHLDEKTLPSSNGDFREKYSEKIEHIYLNFTYDPIVIVDVSFGKIR